MCNDFPYFKENLLIRIHLKSLDGIPITEDTLNDAYTVVNHQATYLEPMYEYADMIHRLTLAETKLKVHSSFYKNGLLLLNKIDPEVYVRVLCNMPTTFDEE